MNYPAAELPVIVLIKSPLICSILFRLTPKSDVPTREADRECMVISFVPVAGK